MHKKAIMYHTLFLLLLLRREGMPSGKEIAKRRRKGPPPPPPPQSCKGRRARRKEEEEFIPLQIDPGQISPRKKKRKGRGKGKGQIGAKLLHLVLSPPSISGGVKLWPPPRACLHRKPPSFSLFGRFAWAVRPPLA